MHGPYLLQLGQVVATVHSYVAKCYYIMHHHNFKYTVILYLNFQSYVATM